MAGRNGIYNGELGCNKAEIGGRTNYLSIDEDGIITPQGSSRLASLNVGGTTNYLSIDTGGTVTFLGSAKISFEGKLSAAASASGLLIGGGTSSLPITTDTADAKFVELRCKSSATSGDNRLAYLRYELGGGGGGECIRAFSKITSSTGTARGAHISLDLGTAAGAITGLGVGLDAQLYIGDAAETTGTLYALQGEIFMEGTTSDLPATHAIFSLIANGDSTGIAAVLNAMAIKGKEGSGMMIFNNNSTGATESNGSIRILVDEGSGLVARYLRYWDAQNS